AEQLVAASFFTEDYLLGAVSGAAGSCGRKTGSIRELSLLRAVRFSHEVGEIIFGTRTQESAQPPSRPSFSCPRSSLAAAPLTAPSWSSSVKKPAATSCSAHCS